MVTGGNGLVTTNVDILELLSIAPSNLRFHDGRMSRFSGCGGLLYDIPYVFGRRPRFARANVLDGYVRTFQLFPFQKARPTPPFAVVSLGNRLWIFSDKNSLYYGNGTLSLGPTMEMVLEGSSIINIGANTICVIGGMGWGSELSLIHI